MSCLLAAINYARSGWFVFPADTVRKKSYMSMAHSEGRKWGMTRDVEEVQRIWAQWPDAGIGLPTGSGSGFWVVEIDTPDGHNVDGLASLRALQETYGPIPLTRMAESPSGSVHYYFKWPQNVSIKNSTSRIALGIDVRGEGGMVLAPPSLRGTGSYRWLNDAPLVEAPPWLITKSMDAGRRAESRNNINYQVDPERLRRALKIVPNDDLGWDDWNTIAMAIYAATGGSSEGMTMFLEWSAKSRKHDERNGVDKWRTMHTTPPTSVNAGTIFFKANEAQPGWDRITRDDFIAYLPLNDFIFVPTREHWPATSADAELGPQVIGVDDHGENITIKASAWLRQNRKVHQMTWAPGKPMIIKDSVVSDGGWIETSGARTFNTYRAPLLVRGNSTMASMWTGHIDRIYPSDAGHIIAWLAHRVQRPAEKINHALVLGGNPGVGKDTLLEPVKRAIGHWNFAEVSPHRLLKDFTAGYFSSVILRINEARDLGDVNRFAFYDHMKAYTAAPPDALKVNEKFIKEYYIENCVGVCYTTNYKINGLYLPRDDRRHYVAWSQAVQTDFPEEHWNEMWDWLNTGGDTHVAAYLANYDLSNFNAKANPPRTDAFWEMVESNDSPEDMSLADRLEALGNPDAVTIKQIVAVMSLDGLDEWFKDRKNIRQFPHKMLSAGYESIKNPDAQDGVWKINKERMRVYAKRELSEGAKKAAARACKTRMESTAQGGPREAEAPI